jgi:hypothetical protein
MHHLSAFASGWLVFLALAESTSFFVAITLGCAVWIFAEAVMPRD